MIKSRSFLLWRWFSGYYSFAKSFSSWKVWLFRSVWIWWNCECLTMSGGSCVKERLALGKYAKVPMKWYSEYAFHEIICRSLRIKNRLTSVVILAKFLDMGFMINCFFGCTRIHDTFRNYFIWIWKQGNHWVVVSLALGEGIIYKKTFLNKLKGNFSSFN